MYPWAVNWKPCELHWTEGKTIRVLLGDNPFKVNNVPCLLYISYILYSTPYIYISTALSVHHPEYWEFSSTSHIYCSVQCTVYTVHSQHWQKYLYITLYILHLIYSVHRTFTFRQRWQQYLYITLYIGSLGYI